jgi:hypothetical protein
VKLLFERIETLPRLAWCVQAERGVPFVRVRLGSDVETGPDFFCEGAWAGEFASTDFECSQLMGSGGKLDHDGLLFATPSHTMERLWVIRQADQLVVSNSCAFALAQAGDEPDPQYLLYGPKLASIARGLDKYVRAVPTRRGNRIRMFCYCNLRLGADHRLTECPKPPAPDFTDYADYTAFLQTQVAAIARNANAPERRARYRAIATISSGYDSAASAVLASRIGCDEAITFRSSRPSSRPEGADGVGDSGAAIAARLGMKVRTYDRFDYLQRTGFPEAEGGISEFLWLDEALERRILITGFNGGAVWDRSNGAVGPFLRRKDTSGDTLSEFRLRVGFVHLAVPYLGATSHASIDRISQSKEMHPWYTGNEYDKAIPRRLIEEAGVDRGMFGVAKRAVAVVAREEGFERTMTSASFADFFQFVEAHRSLDLTARLALYRALQPVAQLNRAFNRTVARASKMAGKPIWLPPIILALWTRLGGLASTLFSFTGQSRSCFHATGSAVKQSPHPSAQLCWCHDTAHGVRLCRRPTARGARPRSQGDRVIQVTQ